MSLRKDAKGIPRQMRARRTLISSALSYRSFQQMTETPTVYSERRDCTSALAGLDVHYVHISITDLQDIASISIQYRNRCTDEYHTAIGSDHATIAMNFPRGCNEPCGKRSPCH